MTGQLSTLCSAGLHCVYSWSRQSGGRRGALCCPVQAALRRLRKNAGGGGQARLLSGKTQPTENVWGQNLFIQVWRVICAF